MLGSVQDCPLAPPLASPAGAAAVCAASHVAAALVRHTPFLLVHATGKEQRVALFGWLQRDLQQRHTVLVDPHLALHALQAADTPVVAPPAPEFCSLPHDYLNAAQTLLPSLPPPLPLLPLLVLLGPQRQSRPEGAYVGPTDWLVRPHSVAAEQRAVMLLPVPPSWQGSH